MTHSYHISGMTCGSCVSKVKSGLLMLGDVTEAAIQLQAPQARITMQRHIPLATLQAALSRTGTYTITEADRRDAMEEVTSVNNWIETYKPIFLIAGYITGTTLLIEWVRGGFNWHSWMQHFMAGFFLVFSFFKLLNLKGFAESYAGYDIIARRWFGWGYAYAFIELALGIAYLTGFNPLLTNSFTFVLMSISIVGVLQSVLNKRRIKCACLGAVFNLPMSTITIIEDAAMIAMSGAMILWMLSA